MSALGADLCERFVKRALCALCGVCIERERDPSQPSSRLLSGCEAGRFSGGCTRVRSYAKLGKRVRITSRGCANRHGKPRCVERHAEHTVAISDRACAETNSASAISVIFLLA